MSYIPYYEIPGDIAMIIENYPVKRTGVKLALEGFPGSSFTIFTQRLGDWEEIVRSLPAIEIDVLVSDIAYDKDDSITWRLIPITVTVYIPLRTRDKSIAEAIAEEELSDRGIKQVMTDLESVLDAMISNKGVTYDLEMVAGNIPEQAFEFDEAMGVRVRVGMVHMIARCAIG